MFSFFLKFFMITFSWILRSSSAVREEKSAIFFNDNMLSSILTAHLAF